jgi:hypothetical protein
MVSPTGRLSASAVSMGVMAAWPAPPHPEKRVVCALITCCAAFARSASVGWLV